jgi:hypothetical protein
LANEQNAFLVRELVAVWLYFREPPPAQGENMPSKDVSVLITKFSEYWCLLEALRTAASIDSLWRIVSKFCRGEFKKRSESDPPKSKNETKKKLKQQPKAASLDQKTAPQWGNSTLLIKQEDNVDDAMSIDEPMSMDEPQQEQQHQREYLRKDQQDDAYSSDESMSADEDEAAAQGLWLWWQHASAAANTAINCVQSTAAAAKRLRSG